jgi:two-component system, sensor histidine kinase and response regulator
MNRAFRIVVVEDSETQAFKMRLLLEDQGWQVTIAGAAEAALAALGDPLPDLMLVDFNLPGMRGDEFCRRIRMNMNTRGIPILMMTASAPGDAEIQSLDSGADGYVSKSDSPEILLSRMRALLRSAVGRNEPARAAILNPQDSVFRSARILTIDDSPTQLAFISEELRSQGYEVETESTGLGGLSRLADEKFDCVLVDLAMPEMDGIEVCRRIAAMHQSLNSGVAVIILTSSTNKGDLNRGLEAGADDFVGKSSDLGVLRARIQALMRRRFFQEENRRIIEELQTKEMETLEARAGRQMAEARVAMADELVQANRDLQEANRKLNETQAQLIRNERRLEETAAEAEAANRAKSTFLSTMSHEIRTPMNAILGYAQLMLRDPSMGMDAKSNLKIILRSGEHLLALINDVLDMSKIEAGRIELNPVTFNLAKLLDDFATMFRLRAEAKALEFKMLVHVESVPYVLADEGKIRQVLVNLLGNAIKFTARGQIELRVGVERRGAHQPWLTARFEDTGTGITQADQETLFEPFSQAKGNLNTQEGTGLGLAISRKYARLMGGDISVTSNFGKGSVFLFEVPIEPGGAGAAARRSGEGRVIGIRAGSPVPRILVVDDQPDNRGWLTKLLTAFGFSVRSADDGEAAIRTWEEWNPALILMDVHMPVMDGLEATRRIKADPRGKETVIVALTASAMDHDRQAVAESGADDFLSKPCRDDELLEKMRPFLKIAYDYEETAEGIAAVTVLTPERLGQLPRKLVADIRNAMLAGNTKLLNKLIREAGESEDAGFVSSLQALADKFEYVALTRLLEEV